MTATTLDSSLDSGRDTRRVDGSYCGGASSYMYDSYESSVRCTCHCSGAYQPETLQKFLTPTVVILFDLEASHAGSRFELYYV